MAIGSLTCAFWLVKIMESEDGSTTPLALVLAAVFLVGSNTLSFEPIERAQIALQHVAAKIEHSGQQMRK